MRWLIALLIVALTLSVYFWSEAGRYTVVDHGVADDPSAYKLDRRTGRLWVLFHTEEIEISPRPPSSASTPEDRAISIAKQDFSISTNSTEADSIRSALQSMRGPLRIFGWKAAKIDDQTYLVTYLLDQGPGSQVRGWAFEVNLEAGIVRSVVGDEGLERKYPNWAQHAAGR